MQACNGLADTGIVDDSTWQQLLGQDAEPQVLLLSSNSTAHCMWSCLSLVSWQAIRAWSVALSPAWCPC